MCIRDRITCASNYKPQTTNRERHRPSGPNYELTMNEPYKLWGALAVAIPIAIHFWHRKQGKLLPWAATGWLEEKQQQQSRGLRLDDRWLLLVRCLLVVLLAILLAQPIL